MDLHDYLEVFRRRWVSATIVLLVITALTTAGTMVMTPQYTATTRLFFAVEDTETVTDLAQGSSFAVKQMTSYAEVATSPVVLGPVITKLGLDQDPTTLAKSVKATIPPETVILEISVTDTSAELAASIANAVGARVAEVAAQLSAGKAVKATPIAPALIPTSPSSPIIPRNLALGVALGLLLGLGVALLRHLLDTRVRSEQDVRAVTASPLLGTVGYDDKLPNHPLILRDEPLSAAAEAIRRLRTNLQFTTVGDRPRSIVITSSIPGEGKSTISLNLALAMADAGARVILVDSDLRRPSVASSVGLEGQVGLTTVLIGRAEVEDVVHHWEKTSLDILPSGRIPPNPSELLGSSAMAKLLDQLTVRYDVVLLDSPPLLPVTDAAVLSKLAGGALVIAGADRVHRPQLRESLEALETAGAHVQGVVLNRIARQETGAYTYYSGYAPRNPPDPRHAEAQSSSEPTARPAADATAPKRARVDASPQPVPLGARGAGPNSTSSGTPGPGADPATVRRATPVGR